MTPTPSPPVTRRPRARARRALRAAVVVLLVAAAACSNPPATGTVTGTLRAYGGPATLGGGMTLNGAPQAHSTVTATSSTGATTRVTTTAAGVFTLTLPVGTYILTGACGGDLTIRITANQTLHRDLPCSVP